MTIYRLVELHCDGDDGDCPAQPDMSRSMQSATLLWKIAKRHGWKRRRVDGRLLHFCDECVAEMDEEATDV